MDIKLSSSVAQEVLRCSGHTEIMEEQHMARRVLRAEATRRLVRGGPTFVCIDSMQVAMSSTGMTAGDDGVRNMGEEP